MNQLKLLLLNDSGKLNHMRLELIENYCVRLSNGYFLFIPKGYVTDLSSVPKFLHSFMSPLHTGTREAGIVHDYLYDNWRFLQLDLPEASSRKWCDEEFRKLCRLNWRKWARYFALRISRKAKKMYYD